VRRKPKSMKEMWKSWLLSVVLVSKSACLKRLVLVFVNQTSVWWCAVVWRLMGLANTISVMEVATQCYNASTDSPWHTADESWARWR
jgi:hypothetical protein